MSEQRPKLGQLIDAINERSKLYDASANQACREAVNRRDSDKAADCMQRAADYLARHSASVEMAAAAVELVMRFWPTKELQAADELAQDARAHIECDAPEKREELKVGYFRYLKARGLDLTEVANPGFKWEGK